MKDKIKRMEDKNDDIFLKNLIKILGLSEDFKFNEETKNTKISSSIDINQLQKLCENEEERRRAFNKIAEEKFLTLRKNINWPYEITESFFNIKLK